MKIAMLVGNPCNPDQRVIKQAESLASEGHEVRIFCFQAPSAPDKTKVNGVEYVRLEFNIRKLFDTWVRSFWRTK